MRAVVSQPREANVLLALLVGLAACVATGTPFGLLAPFAALLLYAGGTATRIVNGALAVAAGVLALAAGLAPPDIAHRALDWAAFCAVAFAVGRTIAIQAGRSPLGRPAIATRIIEAMPAHAWSADPGGRFTYVSPNTLDYLGAPVADLAPLPGSDEFGWRRVVHPEDYGRVIEAWRHSLATGDPYDTEHRLRRHDGIYRWFRNAGLAERDREGRIVGWHGTTIDIDDQKRAEAALVEREREMSRLVDLVPSHLWRLAPDGEPIFFNRRMANFLGFDVGTMSNPGLDRLDRLAAAVHPDDQAAFRRTLGWSLHAGEPFALRYRLRRADGAYHWMSSRAEPLTDEGGRIVQWYGLCLDIDDQVRAQDEARRRERELAQLVDMVPGLLWRLDPDGRPVFFSKRMVEYFGDDVEAFDLPGKAGVGASATAHVHPDDLPRVIETLDRCLTTGEGFALNHRLRRADGVYRWMSVRAEPLRDESGAITQWYGLCHDIDDQLRIEETLRERERALWQLVETLPAMIVCADPAGEPVYRSERLRTYLGFGVETLDGAGETRLNRTLDAAIHPDDRAAVKEHYARCLATGEPYLRKHRLRRFDGEYRWVETRAAPMRGESGDIVQWNLICLDIDGEVRAREELRLAHDRLTRASHAASLAELSASIAHEVNQPLAAVVANSHACHRWLSAAPPNLERAKTTAERIIRDANAAADVVGRIRALFRQSAETRDLVAPADVITEARELMAEEATRRRIRLLVEIATDVPPACVDRVQIQQVLVNLIRNGMDAVEAPKSERAIRIEARRMDDAIRIAVSDCGGGILSPEKIFEPFFTTKDQGMGMGLAICRSIVEAHGGRLWAEANAPRGATFVFTLPVSAAVAP
ncbi:PAS domain-containing protein [Acuticoccus sp. M5D2P5]|nr:PAS domain-containing protein [Acuticoccus kalidii]MCF3935357.1 PAS domain-containing protein [Acuticoccus kalidii]